MAEALRVYWADFENRLPRLSPNELEWLTGEMDTVRIGRAMRMREFHLWTLGNLADQWAIRTISSD